MPPTAMALFTASSGLTPAATSSPNACPPSSPALPKNPPVIAPASILSRIALAASDFISFVTTCPSTAFTASVVTAFLTTSPTAAFASWATPSSAPSRATAPPTPPDSASEASIGNPLPNWYPAQSIASDAVLTWLTSGIAGALIWL